MNKGRERGRNAYEEPNTISPRFAHRRKTKTSIRVFQPRRFSSGVFCPHSDRNTAQTDARKQGRDDPSSLRAHSHLLPNGQRSPAAAPDRNGGRRVQRLLAEGHQKLDLAARLGIESIPNRSLWQPALTRAMSSGAAVYDTLFVELAVQRSLPLVTLDRNVLKKFPEIAHRPGSLPAN